jgi:hypothetical protein
MTEKHVPMFTKFPYFVLSQKIVVFHLYPIGPIPTLKNLGLPKYVTERCEKSKKSRCSSSVPIYVVHKEKKAQEGYNLYEILEVLSNDK